MSTPTNSIEIAAIKAIAFVICFVLLCITAHCQHTNYSIRKAIEAGAAPFDARCALSSAPHNNTMCSIQAAIKND